MHLNDLPRILLRLWWLVVAVTVVVAGATMWAASASRSYAARTDVTVVGTNVADDLSAERVAVFVRGEIPVYQSLMRTPQVLERAVEISGQDVTPEALGRGLVVSVNQQVLTLRVEADSPERSQALAAGAAAALVEAITEIHRQSDVPVVRAVALDQLPAAAATTSSSRTLLLGLALGLVLGCAAAALVSLARGRAGSATELSRVVDELVLGDFPGKGGAPEAGRWLRAVVQGKSGSCRASSWSRAPSATTPRARWPRRSPAPSPRTAPACASSSTVPTPSPRPASWRSGSPGSRRRRSTA